MKTLNFGRARTVWKGGGKGDVAAKAISVIKKKPNTSRRKSLKASERSERSHALTGSRVQKGQLFI